MPRLGREFYRYFNAKYLQVPRALAPGALFDAQLGAGGVAPVAIAALALGSATGWVILQIFKRLFSRSRKLGLHNIEPLLG